MKKIQWTFKINMRSIVLMLIGYMLNYVGSKIANTLELPIWLDSLGTAIVAVELGPLAGAIVGMLSNFINGIFVSIINMPYFLVGAAMGISIGILYPKNRDMFQLVSASYIISFIAIAISTTLNLYLYNGALGNKWGDALYSLLRLYNMPRVLCSVAGQAITDIPDKAITLLLCTGILVLKDKCIEKWGAKKNEKA